MKFIVDHEKKIPVVQDVDVVVVGGGIAGVAAAVAAARNKANTLLVEKNGVLGGVTTAGLMASMDNYGFFTRSGFLVTRGIALEMVERLVECGGVGNGWKTVETPKIPFDPEIFKLVLIDMIDEARVKTLFNSCFIDAVSEIEKIKSVIVANKAGRLAILGRTFIDCSGDAIVAERAGAPCKYASPCSTSLEFRMGNVNLQKTYEYFEQHPEEWQSLQDDLISSFEEWKRNWLQRGFFYLPHGSGKSLRLLQNAIKRERYLPERGMCTNLDTHLGMDGLGWNNTVVINTGVFNIDALDPWENSKAELEARRIVFYAADFLRQHFPGFDASFVIATASYLGVRSTRWIEGEYTLTNEEIRNGRSFEDVIGVAGGAGGRSGGRLPRGFDIPYRCILPKKVSNLLVASGKSASTRPRGLLRGQTRSIQLGQAAGVAASIASKNDTSFKDLEISQVQKALLKQGVWLGDKNRLVALNLQS